MKIVHVKVGSVNKNIYNSNMKRYHHEHVYVYKFDLKSKRGGTVEHEYMLCTNHDGPNSKPNRVLLEQMLRLVYGHYPKGVRFAYER